MNMWKEVAFAASLTAASLLSIGKGYAHEIKIGEIVIEHPWAREAPMAAGVMAGFMKIKNEGKTDDRLIKATLELAPKVQLHDMKMEGDVMKMFELPGGIAIPAGKTVELKPKSLHVMFMDMTEHPKQGAEIKGTLVFEKAGTVSIDYEVKAPDAGMNMN
ncbi:copper chaperone PCu(A)C [Aestuariivirga sp.]|uniref:copper chaperone PCu(A)C n=1 Tax=Aestuariivirga sp. TaxID=2650926 RepID=UPI0039E42D7D